MRVCVLTFFCLFACSSAGSTPTGSASSNGVGGVEVRSAYSVNTTSGSGQVAIYLVPDSPGTACGSLRGHPASIVIFLNVQPDSVGGKTFPVSGSGATGDQAEVLMIAGAGGDAAAWLYVSGGTLTFTGDSTQAESKGSFSITTTPGMLTITGSFDAPGCNGN
jgi:hypothetical protein